jgi:hypothetical protein
MAATTPDTEGRRLLRPPQFGLKTLLGLVTACGMLLALAQWLHPAAVALLGFLIVSVFCHVAGNAIGTRLRASSSASIEPDLIPRASECPKPHQFAPPSLLSRRQSLGWLVLVATSIGILSGAVGGGLWTFLASAGPADLMSIAIGVIAFAVLGGLAAFLTIGFVQVLVISLWQAMRAPPPLTAADSSSEGG